MCQNVIGFAHTPRYLIVCRRSVIYFLFMYVRNKIHTCILAINFKDQISIIAFLYHKIISVFKWWGVTRKSSLRILKRWKHTFSAIIQRQKLNPDVKLTSTSLFSHINSTYLFSLYIMMCINFPITVRLLQNNERGFPLIFTITVVEWILTFSPHWKRFARFTEEKVLVTCKGACCDSLG
jgi:hypothetical protein